MKSKGDSEVIESFEEPDDGGDSVSVRSPVDISSKSQFSCSGSSMAVS